MLVTKPSEESRKFNEVSDNICKKLDPLTELQAKGGMEECKKIVEACCEKYKKYLFRPIKPKSEVS